MSYYNDPFGRYYRSQQKPTQRTNRAYGQNAQEPTVQDYRQLAHAYQQLRDEHERLAGQLSDTEQALTEQTKRAVDLNEELQAMRAEQETAREQEDSGWQERYLRLQAENENYRRRLTQRTEADAARRRDKILEDMLPLADHLEMALKHIDQSAGRLPSGQDSVDEAGFRQSVQATLDAFLDTLRKHGVQALIPLGEPFDPSQHEALGQIAADDTAPEHVAAVVRTGYTVDGRLLRPAQVLVGKSAVDTGRDGVADGT